MSTARILVGDVRTRLRELPDASVQTVVTSPPYWGLRDYGTAAWTGGDPTCSHRQGRPGSGRADGVVDDRMQRNRDGVGSMGGDCGTCGARRIDSQIGLERSPIEYVAALCEVFAEVWRVLRDDGTVWLNLGDSYATGAGAVGQRPGGGAQGDRWAERGAMTSPNRMPIAGLKPKDLVGIPWRVAFALQAAGWYLRSDIIWSKPNPMPESVTDRPTKAHEYIFLLSKSERYYFDADAIAEPALRPEGSGNLTPYVVPGERPDVNANIGGGLHQIGPRETRNKRSVWHVATQPYPEAHFATYPEALIEPCILAGSKVDDTVLDPFCGSGTTGVVACRHNRHFLGVELNPAYAVLAEQRISGDLPLFTQVATDQTPAIVPAAEQMPLAIVRPA